MNEYSIMIIEPNAEMKHIHNRMPVILHKDDYADWLKPEQSVELACSH
jgi:putative SOS response-associated peptidase YedK